ncbi:hypothetical protein ACE0DR_07100 [Azotobacter sp. CWF10]
MAIILDMPADAAGVPICPRILQILPDVGAMAVFPACHLLYRRLRRYSPYRGYGKTLGLRITRTCSAHSQPLLKGESANAVGMPIRRRQGHDNLSKRRDVVLIITFFPKISLLRKNLSFIFVFFVYRALLIVTSWVVAAPVAIGR